MLICWLVVSNMTFIFHNIWDVILPIDELIFFKMVSQPPTSIFLEVFFGELPTKAKHQPQRARNPSSCTCPNFCTEPGCWALPQPQKCPEFWRCWWLSMFFLGEIFVGRRCLLSKLEEFACQAPWTWKNSCCMHVFPANTLCCHVPAPLSSTVICAMCGATRNPAQDQLWGSKRHQGRFFGIQWNWANLQLWGDIPSGKLT